MPGLHLYVSNRLEHLLEQLAEVVSVSLPSPLRPEVIVVQSRGMERWVSQRLAERLGIWANARFPFPNAIFDESVRPVLGLQPGASVFDPERLTWRILRLLPTCLELPQFESLNHYLNDPSDSLRWVQLAEEIAEVFDQYSIYRPAMLLDWEAGRESHWQAELWRRLTADTPTPHRAALYRQLLNKLRSGHLEVNGLPGRLSVFGIPSLPPFHLNVFEALSSRIEVHLFYMNPSKEYWGEIVSQKTMARAQAGQMQLFADGLDHHEVGNPLLASLGKAGLDFFRRVTDLDPQTSPERFESPGEDTVLHCVQTDILMLHDRSRQPSKRRLELSDRSIQIHCCHSPVRELEVLYDQLLALFETLPGLNPADVAVMATDIEPYAPFVTAVFSGSDGRPAIPFSIADRNARQEGRLIQTFLKLLRLAKSRLGAVEVLDLLEAPAVCRRFEWLPSDLKRIVKWVEETHIRWGIDGNDRTRHGLPEFDENSWLFGLRRLLLGYAMPGDDDRSFSGILPYSSLTGGEGPVLGRLAECLQRLFSFVPELQAYRSLAEWSRQLARFASHFLAPDEDSELEWRLLHNTLADLGEMQAVTDFDGPLNLDAVIHLLSRRLEKRELGHRFLTGAVTFCSLLPMRSLPFRVIAVLGLNHGSFPRPHHPPGFDLIARVPQPGDRSRRQEDRYLFLESLLSSRDVFYLSYVGQSLRDNSETPPSVVVSELIEYVTKSFLPPEERALSHRSGPTSGVESVLVTRHRLQTFSPAYFSGEGPWFSYSEENRRAAEAHRDAQPMGAPFVKAALEEARPEQRRLTIAELKRFFRNPANYFLRNTLGAWLPGDAAPLVESEPFDLSGLDRYQLGQVLLQDLLDQESDSYSFDAISRSGVLPPGEMGKVLYRKLWSEAKNLAGRLNRLSSGEPLEPLDVDFEIEDFRLSGRLDRLFRRHLLRYRFAEVNAKDRLSLWIEHLVLNCCGSKQHPSQSVLFGSDGVWQYASVPRAQEVLANLLRFYWRGLNQPMRFFPKSSYQYAAVMATTRNRNEALRKARSVWTGSSHSAGEKEDIALNQVFGETPDPLTEEFEAASMEIFEPMLNHENPWP
ncbi:MAG: exodeoxyribonuclease V subunit gamma [Acidobacteriota bacterium]